MSENCGRRGEMQVNIETKHHLCTSRPPVDNDGYQISNSQSGSLLQGNVRSRSQMGATEVKRSGIVTLTEAAPCNSAVMVFNAVSVGRGLVQLCEENVLGKTLIHGSVRSQKNPLTLARSLASVGNV